MRVILGRYEIEEAIRRYIKSEYLSDYNKYNFGEIDVDSFDRNDDFDAVVECKKIKDTTPTQQSPTPPKMY